MRTQRNFIKMTDQPLIAMALAIVLIISPLANWSTATEPRNVRTANNGLSAEEKIVHVLNRLGYGPRPGDIERVKAIGLEKYIEQQLNPERINDDALAARVGGLETMTMSAKELIASFPPPQALKKIKEAEEAGNDKAAKRGKLFELNPEEVKGKPGQILLELAQDHLLRAVYSERQLQEVMVDFWTNHFNVFWAKGIDRYLLTSYQREVIRPNAMGSFPKLLAATAHSPAMLFYLDNWMSIDPNAAERFAAERERRGRNRAFNNRNQRDEFGGRRGGAFNNGNGLNRRNNRIDRNEINPPNELHMPRPEMSLETPEQQPARKAPRRSGLNENYARELMELHTMGVDGGYTQKDVTEVARCLTGWTIRRDGDEAGFNFNERLHDNGEKVVLGVKIASGGGKNDGDRVLEILANHPSTARFLATKLVRHFVADNPPAPLVERVAATYTKTGGDIRAMLKTIFTSQEFFSRASYTAKVKSPLALVASALRAVNAETSADAQILFFLARMGQPLFLCQPPTGYGDTADKWINTAALVERLNFAVALCEGRIKGTTPRLVRDTNNAATLDNLIETVMHVPVGEATRQALADEMGERITPEKAPKLIGLLLGSPEFQRM